MGKIHDRKANTSSEILIQGTYCHYCERFSGRSNGLTFYRKDANFVSRSIIIENGVIQMQADQYLTSFFLFN